MTATKAELLAECRRLTQESKYNEEQGYSYWDTPKGEIQCGRCTNGALLIAEKFGGYVAGYLMDFQPKTWQSELVARDCGGHDFAIVGDYLVDWWAWDYEESIPEPVLHLVADAELIARKYLPRAEWEITPENDYRRTTTC